MRNFKEFATFFLTTLAAFMGLVIIVKTLKEKYESTDVITLPKVEFKQPIQRGQVNDSTKIWLSVTDGCEYAHLEGKCTTTSSSKSIKYLCDHPNAHPCKDCFYISPTHTALPEGKHEYVDCRGWHYYINDLNERVYMWY